MPDALPDPVRVDPALPTLSLLTQDPAGVLADPSWVPAPPLAAPEPGPAQVEVQLLAARPGRRATLRVQVAGLDVVVKLVRAQELSSSLRAARVPDASLEEHVRAPALLAVSTPLGALALPVLSGTGVDRLPADERATALARLPAALAAVHELPGDGLPVWGPGPVVTKLERAAAAAAVTGPGAASLVAQVRARLAAPDRMPGGATVHGDVSLRNLLWDAGAGRAGLAGLALLDWDRAAVGPREVDLAGVVGVLLDTDPELAAVLPASYERASGRSLDRRLLSDLVAANRLTRVLRRAATGKDAPPVVRRRLAEVAEALAG